METLLKNVTGVKYGDTWLLHDLLVNEPALKDAPPS